MLIRKNAEAIRVLVAVCLIFLGGLAPFEAIAAGDADPAAWKKKMQELGGAFTELVSDLSSEERFAKFDARVLKNAKIVAKLAHQLEKMPADGKSMVDPDPSVAFLSALFANQAQHGYDELKRGHRSYARGVLRSVAGYCIACHSRNTSGATTAKAADPLTLIPSGLRSLEKAEFLTVTRKFPEAFEALEKIVANPQGEGAQGLEWERAARLGLVVSIRVLKNADAALRIVDRILVKVDAPLFLKEQAQAWKTALEKWKTEAIRETPTESGLYAEAVRLVSEAVQSQKYPADRSADVSYLRASAALHELLTKYPAGSRVNESLFLTGVAYQALQDLQLWELHDLYFESCARRAGKSDLGLRCYQRMEESLYAAYSGSGGVHLPTDVLKRLSDLRNLVSVEVKN